MDSDVTLFVHYWADLQLVHGFHRYDNIALNAKCQSASASAHSMPVIPGDGRLWLMETLKPRAYLLVNIEQNIRIHQFTAK